MSRTPIALRAIVNSCLFLLLISSFRCVQAYTMHATLHAPLPGAVSRVSKPPRFRDHPAHDNIRNMSARQAIVSAAARASAFFQAPSSQVPSANLAVNSGGGQVQAQRAPAIQPAPNPAAAATTQKIHERGQENQEIILTQKLLSSKQQKSAGNKSCFLQERQHLDSQMLHAIDKVLAGDKSISQESYSLDFETEQLLQKNNIDTTDFTHCSGNAVTLQKHHEIIVILNKISDLHDALAARDPRPASSSFAEILYHFLDSASLSNKEGQLFASCRITDFSWAGLEYLYAAAHGAKAGGMNIFYALSDPIGTGAHVAQAALEMGRFLGHFCAEMVALQAHMSYQEVCALNNLKPDGCISDLKEIKLRLCATQSIGAILEKALKDFANKSGPERVGLITELGTEYILTGPVAHRIARGASLLCGRAAKQAKNIMRAIKKGERFEQAVAAAGGLELRIAQETLTFFDNAGEAMPKGPGPGLEVSSAVTHRFSSAAINEGVEWVFKTENKVKHLFGNVQHNLDPLVQFLGGERNVIKSVLEGANGAIPSVGLFEDIPVAVGGYVVYVRGCVVNGIPKIGTMFIK